MGNITHEEWEHDLLIFWEGGGGAGAYL